MRPPGRAELRTHVSAERDASARGRQFGSAQRDAVLNTVAVYGRLLREAAGVTDASMQVVGAAVGEALARRWPDLLLEIEGIARGAGVPAETLLAINARTELLSAPECSLVARVGNGGCVLMQNWDWHPELAESVVVWTVRGDEGRWFTTLTEAGMLAKIGLSSAGLACGLNFLRSSLDGGTGGVPIHILLRVFLDRVDSLPDALKLALDTSVTASSCVTLGAGEGAVVAAELSPGGCRLIRPDGDRLSHTNHFLDGPPGGEDLEATEAPSTLARLDVLRRTDPERALRSHDGAPESVCRHDRPGDAWADRRATLASVVIEPGKPRFRVAAGPPCERPLVDIALP